MGYNIVSGIVNIANFRNSDLKSYASKYLIRVNAVGEQLEYYVKDALANSFTLLSKNKDNHYSSVFSYLGNQNNPPDIIIKSGDAFEIKKLSSSAKGSIQLNSSPPKDRLLSSDPRITQHCRNCEASPWTEKDIFYVVGFAKNGRLKHLFFVHGKCYAAEKSTYEKISLLLKRNIRRISKEENLEYGETKELGRVKRVDPLGITELRVRGMWILQNPNRVFDYIYEYDESKDFSLAALMTTKKYLSFPKSDIHTLEEHSNISIKNVEVKDPNNPAKMMNAKLITTDW